METDSGLDKSHSLLMIEKRLKFFVTIACVYLIFVLTVSYNGKEIAVAEIFLIYLLL